MRRGRDRRARPRREEAPSILGLSLIVPEEDLVRRIPEIVFRGCRIAGVNGYPQKLDQHFALILFGQGLKGPKELLGCSSHDKSLP